MSDQAEAFRESVIAALRQLKAGPNSEPGFLRTPIEGGGVLVLRPLLGGASGVTGRDIDLITAWRHRHRESFLTWFTPTAEGTRRWLQDIHDADDRLIFMAEADGVPFGHIGVRSFDFHARTCEVDSVARGRDDVLPGGMTEALRLLLNWLFGPLHCAEAFVRVFADNPSAVALYERCGFRLVRTVPLEAVTEGAIVRWVEQPEGVEVQDRRRLAYMKAGAPP